MLRLFPSSSEVASKLRGNQYLGLGQDAHHDSMDPYGAGDHHDGKAVVRREG